MSDRPDKSDQAKVERRTGRGGGGESAGGPYPNPNAPTRKDGDEA